MFLRDQDVTPEEMKRFIARLSTAAGCPASSGLHVHPLTEEGSELGDQVSVISSEKQRKGGGLTHQLSDVSRLASAGWHSDITFEPVPSDYAMLKIHTLPETGGDTVRFFFLSFLFFFYRPPFLTGFLSCTVTTNPLSHFFLLFIIYSFPGLPLPPPYSV